MIESVTFTETVNGESILNVHQEPYPTETHKFRIKEYMSIYDQFFSVGLGWIYCTNYLTYEDATELLSQKIKEAQGRSVVYIIHNPEQIFLALNKSNDKGILASE